MKANKITYAATLSLAAMMTLSACSKKDDSAAAMAAMQAQTPTIATITADYGTIDLSQAYPATIKGRTDIDVRPQVSGFITQVAVDEGQHVTKGQTLFVLDQVQFQAAVDQAQQQVNAAQTAVSTARLTADQKQSLFDKNIISEYENQLAKNQLATAQAQLATAQAALTSAKKNLAYTVVTAPSNGVVGSIPFREGSLASPSMAQPLTTISDNAQVYAYFSMSEKELLNMTKDGNSVDSQIKNMPAVQLKLADGTIYPLEGKITTVSGVMGNGTGAATVRALFDNMNGMLRSGSTGQVLIPMESETAITVPQKATFELQDKRFVYVVNDSNKLESRPVTIATLSDGVNYVITSGLEKGDVVAVEAVGVTGMAGPKLTQGMLINPVDAAQAAAMQQQAGQPQQQSK